MTDPVLTFEERTLMSRVRAIGNDQEPFFGAWLSARTIEQVMVRHKIQRLEVDPEAVAAELINFASPLIGSWNVKPGKDVVGHTLAVGVNLRVLLDDWWGHGSAVMSFDRTLREHAKALQVHCESHRLIAQLNRDATIVAKQTGEQRSVSPMRVSDEHNAYAVMGAVLIAMIDRYGLEDRFKMIQQACDPCDGDWLLLGIAARERDKEHANAWLSALKRGVTYDPRGRSQTSQFGLESGLSIAYRAA